MKTRMLTKWLRHTVTSTVICIVSEYFTEDEMDEKLLKEIEKMPGTEKKELLDHLQHAITIEEYPVMLVGDRYDQLLEAVETVFNRKLQKGRHVDDVMMRRFIAYKLREDGYTFSQISRVMGKDHSTIIYLVKQMEDYFALPAMYKEDIKKYLKFHSMVMQDERN